MKHLKYILIFISVLISFEISAQWTKGGKFTAMRLIEKTDGTGRELMFNYHIPNDTSLTGMGFTISVDGRLWDIPVGFIFKNIEWKLGGAFRLSFDQTTDAYKKHYWANPTDTNSLATFYTVYTPFIYSDLRFNFNKHFAIIPQVGVFYGWGNILYENSLGATVDGPRRRIGPEPQGYLIGLTLKLGPIGITGRKFFDDNFYNMTSIGIGFKI
ncbi:MAG: hypothetical protein K9J13_08995 [Saprospiraceae bacterium]|nr:hypothetical protein [Saprospiraceae bacterium]